MAMAICALSVNDAAASYSTAFLLSVPFSKFMILLNYCGELFSIERMVSSSSSSVFVFLSFFFFITFYVIDDIMDSLLSFSSSFLSYFCALSCASCS